ncbi:PPOX class F420-dependent oxidoreductase [Hoyosella subflava]|uniref:Pyridoxamine 5'-phosphate oxidase family protein n=1 Tax=Hoyosella subflava (strain DSM 45089 / JCM 17490 / NBRC 109087 / DQS3-9A1) TaxID=443218 RepID=F6EP33_HOYSD|nr:PPOX class F420-dependent oxidoreductase [Hoyosella subflava]AEF40499.1 Pyridoxamine 5'-phosphate oxidase family protein [Hoyosella subflava DQS3-9A1]
MAPSFSDLAEAEYILLTSFRKSGEGVATAVWAAPRGERLLVWTPTESYKVKRIRRNPRVEVSVCDLRGRPKSEPVEAAAEVLDDAGTEEARAAIAKKYGIKGWIGVKASILRRGRKGTIGLAITVPE